jgi:hypothetical protein
MNKFIIAILLVLDAAMCHAQWNGSLLAQNETIPSLDRNRINNQSGLSFAPVQVFFSNFELAYDYFDKRNIDYKFLVGYGLDSKPSLYYERNGNQVESGIKATYRGNISNLNSAKLEFQIRKFLGKNNLRNIRYSIGAFCQYKSMSGTFNGTRALEFQNTNSIVKDKLFKASAITFGPMFTIQQDYYGFCYVQMGLGSYVVIPLEENNAMSDIFHIPILNPYKSGVNIKLNLSLGFYLN